MRQEVPTWVAVVVIVAVLLVAVFAIWRKTGVQKREMPLPGEMLRKYGAPGPMVPGKASPTPPTAPSGK